MKKVYIAAGGTGGHINAALSMGGVFKDNFDVTYISGIRYLDYQLFDKASCLHFGSRPLRTKNPIKLIISLLYNMSVFIRILLLYISNRPTFIVGAGGYICGPALFAGKILLIPIFIIEQNAIVGMTNKILSRFANIIFTNFENTRGIKSSSKIIQSGNPIRSEIKSSLNNVNEVVNILIFGGSLGATQINESIEILITQSPAKKLNILHQVGKGNVHEIKNINENIAYKQVEYIDNMNEKYDWCNIIISRAGASTVSELRVVKRPSIIVPYPLATDNHQLFNAEELKNEDGFHVEILDSSLYKNELSERISEALTEIISKEIYYRNEIEITDASVMIKTKIENYVWN